MALTVTVSILLYDSAADIRGCLTALRALTRAPDRVVVLDNASTDDGLAVARATMPDVQSIRSEVNLGFAAGQNRAMAAAPADLHLVLNPDARLSPDFLARALEPFDRDPRVGSVTGRLLRFRPDDPLGESTELVGQVLPDDVLDSTGMLAHRNRRVTDRGSDEPAAGRYLNPAYVFGASGAAAVYRRDLCEDVAFDGEFYDESFVSYREDVDVAWRSLLLGWRCEYAPAAVARHRRRVAPGRRRALPASINRNSVRNRWQLLLKNELSAGLRRDWPAIWYRDVQIGGYLVLREQSSLAALGDVARNLPRILKRRRDVMARRSATDEEMIRWFGRIKELPLDAADRGQEMRELWAPPESVANGQALGRALGEATIPATEDCS